jgi:hypothetical protein
MAAGGKDGRYSIAEDGVPITHLGTVVIEASIGSDYNYLKDVIRTFNNGDYIGGAPTLRGTTVASPPDFTEEHATLGLDAVGTMEIPVVSTTADISSGVISIKNGDYLGGGISVAASLPAVGVVFNVGKWAKRAFKWGDKVAAVGKYGDEVFECGNSAWVKEIVHHLASNKHLSKYTPQFKSIASRYKLGLNQAWNKLNVSSLYHYSKHPESYHKLALDAMQAADRTASKTLDGDLFVKVFRDKMIRAIEENPNILNNSGL